MLNLIPWGQFYGVPDFLAITLLYWSVYQRQRVGIAIAFVFGLLMDVNNATILGETALAYTLMTYFAITLHRRILWFSWSRHLGYIFLLLSI
ncbi:MAG: rod shape-determining protein MreD, partial [Oxalobacter sp.]|nr:rod shape-determining protein MreD [Oxalobacter sp.]